MSQAHPQVFEPHLDEILAGAVIEPAVLQGMLRSLLITRRRYNDPYQSGTPLYADPTNSALPDQRNRQTSTYDGCLAGVPYSNRWTIASQKARVEQGIAFLTPIVGASVGDYPPITFEGDRGRSDSMGNFIPLNKP